MKVQLNIEMTPEEARSFFGLPDVTPINEALVAETLKRTQSNMDMLDPSEMMKAWTSMGGVWSDKLFDVMRSAAQSATAANPMWAPSADTDKTKKTD